MRAAFFVVAGIGGKSFRLAFTIFYLVKRRYECDCHRVIRGKTYHQGCGEKRERDFFLSGRSKWRPGCYVLAVPGPVGRIRSVAGVGRSISSTQEELEMEVNLSAASVGRM